MFKKNKGITLIALIISIVIMSIIAVVAINALGDKDGGLIGQANSVVKKHNDGQDSELAMLEQYGNIIKQYQNSRIDWDDILNKANKNPESYKHKSQDPNNENIGIGTDGQPVNMDYWSFMNFNSYIDLYTVNGCSGYPAYTGLVVDGKIQGKVPQYIKPKESEKFIPVTNMTFTFIGMNNLIEAPELPTTVKELYRTFFQCSNLKTGPRVIPSSVIRMYGTFEECDSLQGVMEINTNFKEYFYNNNGTSPYTNVFLNAAKSETLILKGIYGDLKLLAKTQNGNENTSIKTEDELKWDKILEDAKADPLKFKHKDQDKDNEYIGIGTDGNPVNMDYWSVSKIGNSIEINTEIYRVIKFIWISW